MGKFEVFEIYIYRVALLIDKQRRQLTKRQPDARGFSETAYKINSFQAGLCVAPKVTAGTNAEYS